MRLMKKNHLPARFLSLLAALLLTVLPALADDALDTAYQLASKDAGATTTKLVSRIDLDEFADYFNLVLDEDDEQLIRIALMAYSNGAILEHPRGINGKAFASVEEDPYVGNKNSKKFHYSWCSSVSNTKEKNKVTFSSREAAVQAGYEPCKQCNP